MNSNQCHRRSVVLLLLFPFAASAGCDRLPGGAARRHIYRAAGLLDQQRVAEAAAQYDSVLRLDSTNITAVRELGLLRARMGNGNGALPLLTKAQQLELGNDHVRLALGFLYLGRGDTLRARQAAVAALANPATRLEALRLLGVTFLAERQPVPAESVFQNMVRAAPKEPMPHHLVGLALLQQGKRPEATKEFEAALQLSPGYVEPLARLGEIATFENRPDDALARVRRQIELAPKAAGPQELLGVVYLTRHDTVNAETAFKEALRLEPRLASARMRLTQLYQQAGKRGEVEASLTEGVKANPGDPGPLMLLAVSYDEGGQLDAAQRTYARVLALAPEFAPAANNLAWLLSEKRGDTEKALGYAERARKAVPNEPRVADTYGWILYRRGQYQQALPVLEESAARLPDNPATQYHLGMTYKALGQTESARKALTRAVATSADFPGKQEARKALATLKS